MPFPGFRRKKKKEEPDSGDTGGPEIDELIRNLQKNADPAEDDMAVPEEESAHEEEPEEVHEPVTQHVDDAEEFTLPSEDIEKEGIKAEEGSSEEIPAGESEEVEGEGVATEPSVADSGKIKEGDESVKTPASELEGGEAVIEESPPEVSGEVLEDEITASNLPASGLEEEASLDNALVAEPKIEEAVVEEKPPEEPKEAGGYEGAATEYPVEESGEDEGEAPLPVKPAPVKEGSFIGDEEDLSGFKKPRKEKKAVVKEEKKGFLFFTKKVETIRLYNYATDGPLVHPEVPEGYTLVDEYWVNEGRSKVLIVKDHATNLNEYHLFEPRLSRFERELAERLYEDMRDVLILTDEEVLVDREFVLMEKMSQLLSEYNVNMDDDALFKLQYYLLRNFLGWSRLDPLMIDPNIEDISCDGSGIPIFLYHRKFRNIKTNVSFDEETLYSLAILLAQRSGKHISVSQPMLDATLPDGSRLQLTLGKEVTSRGTSFTIRKFREEPFTPIELIDYKTFNVDQLVYFWLAIENNKSLLFVGGTASGKTTSLNAVSLFIPPLSKVVSIEDTREITLFHDNWIATVTRESVTETSGSKIDMFDLLKAAMRQRPEYILVGEVRGVEAQTLFQAMNTGHTTFSTLHANNVDAAIHRLENPPLNVPRNMVQALDIVSIQALVYRGQERVRRALEIVEIAGIDPGTGNLRVNTVFEYDPVTDVHNYSGRSQVYSQVMEVRGWSKEEMSVEIVRRQRVIQAMHDQGIIDYINVTKIFQAYSIHPENVLENIDDLKKAFL